MAGLQDLSDDELNQLIAQQQAAAQPQQSVMTPPPAVAPAQQSSTLKDMSDEELNHRMSQIKPSQNFVINALDGSGATAAQNNFYKDFVTKGPYDPSAEWGTENRPVLGIKDGQAKPGQWYVDLEGNKIQAPSEMKSDLGLGLAAGVLQPWNKAAGWLDSAASNIPGYQAMNQWSHDNLGTALTMDDAKAAQQSFFDRQAQQGHIPGAVGRFGGQVLGTIPLALAAPEGALGAVLTGAGSGALLSNSKTAGGTALDATLGALTAGGLHGMGSFMSKAPILDDAKQALYQMGTKLTPGQILGYPEDLLSKFIPFAGGARAQAMDSFTPAAGNNVLDAIGGRLPRGADPLAYIPGQISSAAQAAATSGDRQAMLAAQEAANRFVPFRAALSEGGSMTPADLVNSARSSGNQAMTDFGQYGSDILGNTVPKGKGYLGLGAMFGDGLVGDVVDHVADRQMSRIPALAGVSNVAKAGTALYSPPGRAVTRALLMGDRPAPVSTAGDLIRGRLGGLFGGQVPNADNYFSQYYPDPSFEWDKQGY